MGVIGLQSGLKALLASQAALDTIGNNVANANTPGYSRQRLGITASPTLQVRGLNIGAGVNADVVTRTTNELLQVRMVGQIGSLNRLGSALGGMSEVEALLGEPGGFGLGGGMNEFFGAVSELSTSTGDLVLRSGLVQKASALTTQFNQLAGTMGSLRFDTANQVGIQVKQVNALSEQLVKLNREIAQTEATGLPANALRDQREEKIRELASYVDIDFNEDPNGVVRITAGGRLLVGGDRSFKMSSVTQQDGSVELRLEGSDVKITLADGAIAGLTQVGETFIPGLMADFDKLAGNMIFEMNRVHSKGTPSAGFFTTLTSAYAFQDNDLDGQIEDELLTNSSLPFDIKEGEFYVNVTRQNTGELSQSTIQIDPATSSVGDLLSELNAIDGVNANLNSFGKLQIFADAGFGFDFAAKLDSAPDKSGTMGGANASLGASIEGPYALTDGGTLDLTGPVSSFSISFDSTDFREISAATADELATVINANGDVQANGLRAVAVADRLYLQTAATGVSASFDVTSGSSLAAFGWAAGTTTTGGEIGVDVEISGAFTSEANDSFTFRPKNDGVVGTTPGLEVDVFSSTGQLVATLDLGDTYQPGTALEVDAGIKVSFGYGELSATDNDSFRAELIADSDTSDILAAVGLNALFTGTGAADIAIRKDLETDPDLIAAGVTGAAGDNQALLAIMDLQSSGVSGLNGESLGDFYGDVVSDVGFEISTASTARDVEEFLLQNLKQRREETSGVNIDEELVDMIRFEQSFSAASRYIQVLNELSRDLLSII